MIEVRNISKSHGGTTALQDISFSVDEGELFGLIGPDGAGKTTLFRILATLQLADKGSARVAGYDVLNYQKIRHHVGYMPGRFSLYQDLSVQENLDFFATVFGTTINANYELIKEIYEQIAPFKKRKAGALSGGMKQKLALCCALIHRPTVLLLDEPTTGVDPVSRKEFWEILGNLKQANMTILVSTPFMDEASRCERIALVNKGSLLAVDTPEVICSSFDKLLLAVRTAADMYTLLKDLRSYPQIESAFPFGQYIHYTGAGLREHQAAELRSYLEAKGHQQVEVMEVKPGIENAFIEYMTNEY